MSKPAVWAACLVGCLIFWGLVAGGVYAIVQQAEPPLYTFCDGTITQVPDIVPCPDGEIRVIR